MSPHMTRRTEDSIRLTFKANLWSNAIKFEFFNIQSNEQPIDYEQSILWFHADQMKRHEHFIPTLIRDSPQSHVGHV